MKKIQIKTQKTQKRIPGKKLIQLKELCLSGKTNKEISTELKITYRLVQYHTQKIKKEQRKRKVGRPKIKLDYVKIEKLATIRCTQEEIAYLLDVSVATLQRDEEFCIIYKKGLANGKMSLRRNLYNLSEKNAAAAIWLSKQFLGMSDRYEVTNIVPDKDIKIEFITRPKVEK